MMIYLLPRSLPIPTRILTACVRRILSTGMPSMRYGSSPAMTMWYGCSGTKSCSPQKSSNVTCESPILLFRHRVMYLQQTDNTRVRKSGKIAPFHPHLRRLHHGIRPNFLQPSPGLSSLAVLHAPCAVARHTSGNAPNATHTDPTTAQASQSP